MPGCIAEKLLFQDGVFTRNIHRTERQGNQFCNGMRVGDVRVVAGFFAQRGFHVGKGSVVGKVEIKAGFIFRAHHPIEFVGNNGKVYPQRSDKNPGNYP